MKTRLLFGLLFFGIQQLSAQITFQETIGGPRNDVPNSISTTSDGGYFIAGFTEKFTYAWQQKTLFVRLDENGDTIWQRDFGGANSEDGTRGRQVQAGFAAVGSTSSYRCGSVNHNMWLQVVDPDGNWLMSSTMCYMNLDIAGTDFVELQDSSFVILGTMEYYNDITSRDIFLTRVKPPYYDTVWTKLYTMPEADYGYSVESTSDGGFIIAGENQSGSHAGFLIKTDSLGNIQWKKSVPTFGWVAMPVQWFMCRQTNDNGYVVSSSYWNQASNTVEILLMKLDATGSQVWAESIRPAGFDSACVVYPTCIEELTDGGFIISSILQTPDAMDDNYVIRTNSTGAVLWSTRIGGVGNERFSPDSSGVQQYTAATRSWICAHEPANGFPRTYGLTSYTTSFNGPGNQNDIYFVKLVEGGTSGCNESAPGAVVTTAWVNMDSLNVTGINIPMQAMTVTPPGSYAPALPVNFLCSDTIDYEFPIDPSIPFLIYPNPTNGVMTVRLHETGLAHFTITNVLGQRIMDTEATGNLHSLDVSVLVEGVYLLSVDQNGERKTMKFVKE